MTDREQAPTARDTTEPVAGTPPNRETDRTAGEEPTGGTSGDALRETAELVWPAPARVLPAGVAPAPDAAVAREFLLVPHARRPRLALPAGAPRVAADVVRKYSQGLTSGEYLTRTVLGGLLGSRAVHALLRAVLRDRLRIVLPAAAGHEPATSLEAHAGDILGVDVLLGLSVGPARANRKPVLQAVTPDGDTRAYLKLGIDPLTRDLVRGEAEALATYWSGGVGSGMGDGAEVAEGATGALRVPRVLHHGTWRGLEMLVLEAVRPRRAGPAGLLQHRRRRTTEPLAAMGELGARLGTVRARLAGGGGASPFWDRIVDTPAALHDEEQAAAYAAGIDAVQARHGDADVTFGAWHGDWTPWNMVWDGPRVLLWDFERFDTCVPVGLDLAHYRLQSRLRDGGRSGAEALLSEPGWAAAGSGPNAPDLVAAAYLLELARRWALIAQLPAGGPLRERTAWLLSRLHSAVSPP